MTTVRGFLVAIAFVLLSFIGADSAHAQLPPGPSLLNGFCFPNMQALPTPGVLPSCVIVVVLPSDPNGVYNCTEFTNLVTGTTIDLPPDAFLNPSGEDCIRIQPGQNGPTQQVRMMMPGLGKGNVIFAARSRRFDPGAPFTKSSGPGLLADISPCRFFNVAVCPLEPISGPIEGCPATCNDVRPGEFPDPFPDH